MPWPSDQDYNEAVQNPKTAFADSELRSGQAELSGLGLPKARSGNFATVYKVVTHGVPHAVRCFRTDNPETNIRYDAITSHLHQTRLPYVAPFRYLSQGIRAGARWYPILKMKWVEGDGLISFIEKNLSSPEEIQKLAAEWSRMLGDLRDANIAHGDLQHGNILVDRGNLKLVDYDGMYVPALDGSRSLELGHRNYQHPERTERDFGPYLDNFSGWLIYASLVAVAARPGLWHQLKAGDECLLFRREDLVAPRHSNTLRLLREASDARLEQLADQLENFLCLPLNKIPYVTDGPMEFGSAQIANATSAARGSWIEDYAARSSRAADDAELSIGDDIPPVTGQEWMGDFLDERQKAGSFVNNIWIDRLASLSLLCSAALLCYSSTRGRGFGEAFAISLALMGTAASLAVVFWRLRYIREPVFAKICATQSELSQAEKNADTAKNNLERFKTQREQQRNSYTTESSRLQSRQAALQADQLQELRDIDAALERQIESGRQALAAEESNEKRKLADTIGSRISTLTRDAAALADRERQEICRVQGPAVTSIENQMPQLIADRDSELTQALQNYQDRIVQSHLHRYKISDASIPGIDPDLKRRLAAAGYASADDIGIGKRYGDVPGLGAKEQGALYDWQRNLESQIRAMESPSSLPPHKSAPIEQRHEAAIKPLQQRLAQLRQGLTGELEKVRMKYSEQKKKLEEQMAIEQNNLRVETAALEKKLRDAQAKLSVEEHQLQVQSQRTAEACRARFGGAAKQLANDLDTLKRQYRTDLASIDKEIADAQKQMRETALVKQRAYRRLAAYAPLTFRGYALHVFGRR